MNGQSTALDYEDHIKDLGITFDEKLDFSVHIAEKINKAYRLLWLIKRNFNEIDNEAFILLHKHLVRAHLRLCRPLDTTATTREELRNIGSCPAVIDVISH